MNKHSEKPLGPPYYPLTNFFVQKMNRLDEQIFQEYRLFVPFLTVVKERPDWAVKYLGLYTLAILTVISESIIIRSKDALHDLTKTQRD